MHYMQDEQLTLRLDHTIATPLRRQARARGVPKSQVVREALAAYLTAAQPSTEASDAAWARVASMAGSLTLDHAGAKRDALARRIRAHDWRD